MPQEKKMDRITLRKQRAEETSKRLIAEGYKRHDLSLDLVTANTRSLLYPLPFVILLIILFAITKGWDALGTIDWPVLVISYIISIPVHEGIHALVFGAFAKNHFASIEFGVVWKSLNPYCYCSEPINKKEYLMAVLAPGFILGLLVGIIAMALGSATWFAFGVLNLFGAGGDIMSAWKLIHFPAKGKELKVLDHPELPGMIVFSKD